MANPTPRHDEFEPAFLGRSAHSESLGVKKRSKGPVTHWDAESLRQPIEFPQSEYRRLYQIVAIAAAIAILIVGSHLISGYLEHRNTLAQVTEVVEAAGNLELPPVTTYAGKSNDDIRSALNDAGYTVFDHSNDEDKDANGFDLIKIPPQSNEEVVSVAYDTGFDSFTAPEAARVFAGSWRILVNRANGNELRLRYVDFSNTNADSAITNAQKLLSIEPDPETAPMADTMGNTNLSGTFTQGKRTYDYTISTCDLDAVYDIDDLPGNAQYVGVKITW